MVGRFKWGEEGGSGGAAVNSVRFHGDGAATLRVDGMFFILVFWRDRRNPATMIAGEGRCLP